MIDLPEADFIIIGQGLAGSLLAWELLEKRQRVLIFDHEYKGAAYKVAAGIINPITGRRFAKSWRIDEFLPFSKDYYKKLEQFFGSSFFTDRTILRFLQGNKGINDWYGRSSWEGFGMYMKELNEMESLADIFHLPFGIGAISPAAQVDLPLLISLFKSFFKSKHLLYNAYLDYDQIQKQLIETYLKKYPKCKLVFCEGHQARFNPIFKAIPFEPAKGEVLILKIPDLNLEHLIKNKLMIAPLGNDLYWTGSNYEWNAKNDRPTAAFKSDFVKKLKKTLKIPFDIVDHRAAIRPTMKDRRPVLGTHPQHEQVAVFNGLGTKGASLGPYWAVQMMEHLLHGMTLDREVDIRRFFK